MGFAVGGGTVSDLHHVDFAPLVEVSQVIRHQISDTAPLARSKQLTTSFIAPPASAWRRTSLR